MSPSANVMPWPPREYPHDDNRSHRMVGLSRLPTRRCKSRWSRAWRGRRAKFHQFLLSPIVAAPLTAFAGVGMALVSPLLSGIGFAPNGLLQFGLAASFSAVLGYSGGRVMAEDSAQNKNIAHQRGTIVADHPSPRAPKPDPPGAHARDHLGRPCRTGAGRDQALQTYRHHGYW